MIRLRRPIQQQSASSASGLTRRDFTGIFASSRSGYLWPHQLEVMSDADADRNAEWFRAEERVAGFLLEMAERVPSGGAVELPMSRQDIADYLGLTIETVSRTLKHLENAAAIEVPKRRRILLRNRSALRRLNA
jgi:DNA-binding transcriptional ArsR family regulator